MDFNILERTDHFSKSKSKREILRLLKNCFRIWWCLIFVICFTGCSVMIYKIYEKYETSPVIVSFATKETPIYKIPFPAVTLCPEVKSDKEKFNLDQIFQKRNFTQTE